MVHSHYLYAVKLGSACCDRIVLPWRKMFSEAVATITSLLYPGAGVVRGILVFRSRFRRDTELQQAAVAGALCMVIRTEEWTPPSRSLVHEEKSES